MGADRANGARMGDGGRNALLLDKGGGGGRAIRVNGLVTVGVLLGKSNEPSS